MILELIEETREIIRGALAKAEAPALLCSFGKDSMVMLALVREQTPSIPVVYFPVFDHPTKHEFAARVTQEWNLRLWPWKPCHRDVIGKGKHVELIESYLLPGGAVVSLPVEAQPGYVPNADCHCAIERLNEPVDESVHSLDLLFVGHRGDDVDPTHGPVPLSAGEYAEGLFTVAYPLAQWTEKDIWEASKLLGIPQNLRRYRDASLAHNADYFDLCTQCLTPGMKGPMVPCPKGGEVFNLGRHLDLDARREALRSRFVNIQPLKAD